MPNLLPILKTEAGRWVSFDWSCSSGGTIDRLREELLTLASVEDQRWHLAEMVWRFECHPGTCARIVALDVKEYMAFASGERFPASMVDDIILYPELLADLRGVADDYEDESFYGRIVGGAGAVDALHGALKEVITRPRDADLVLDIDWSNSDSTPHEILDHELGEDGHGTHTCREVAEALASLSKQLENRI